MRAANTDFTTQAKRLQVGETLSQAVRVPLTDFSAKVLRKKLSSLRNRINQVAARIKEETGRSYRVESGQFVTYDGEAVVIVGSITCMEDDGDDI